MEDGLDGGGGVVGRGQAGATVTLQTAHEATVAGQVHLQEQETHQRQETTGEKRLI